MSDDDEREEPILNPLAWWLWLLMGFVSLGITLAVGAAFGMNPVDLLLFRRDDRWWELSIAGDYGVIGIGLYLMVRQALSKPES